MQARWHGGLRHRSTLRLLSAAALFGTGVLLTTLQCSRPLEASPVPVRFREGTLHGFLVLRDVRDSALAHGDLLQTVRDGRIDSRMIFRFGDGSVFDERVSFTQSSVFSLQSYSLSMRGPSFKEDTQISLLQSGKYVVKTTSHSDDRAEVDSGTMNLPTDVYNGMVITIAKNLTKQGKTRVHYVAFEPKPRLVELDLIPAGSRKVHLGGSTRTALHFVVRPQLPEPTEFFAKLLGKMPPDNHAWIMTDHLPAFVRFEGALYVNGPTWRIELASPRW